MTTATPSQDGLPIWTVRYLARYGAISRPVVAHCLTRESAERVAAQARQCGHAVEPIQRPAEPAE